jgi:hypothetical protein
MGRSHLNTLQPIITNNQLDDLTKNYHIIAIGLSVIVVLFS